MAAPEVGSSAPLQDEDLFRQLDQYPWDADAEFQGGLRAILGPNPPPERAEQLTLRARCFYYSRKYSVPIDFTTYRTWHAQHSSRSLANGATVPNSSIVTDPPIELSRSSISPAEPISVQSNPPLSLPNDTTSSTTTTSPSPPAAPYPPTFSQIVELITTGQPVPNIKEIPDTVLEGQESQATTTKRKKPWERDGAA